MASIMSRKTDRLPFGGSSERPTGGSTLRAGSVILVASLLALLAMSALTPAAWAAKAPSSVAITALTPACAGISVTGTGSNGQGIGRSDFVLIDLTKDSFTNLVDSKYFYYSKPLPKQITETWTSGVSLIPGTPYRVFFHIWDTTGHYWFDRQDFSCV